MKTAPPEPAAFLATVLARIVAVPAALASPAPLPANAAQGVRSARKAAETVRLQIDPLELA